MRNILLDKLEKELNKDIKEECQVVYILSRIRKMIEIDGKKDVYRKLKFYCDWSLHDCIENTGPISDILGDFINHKDSHGFLKFDPFIEEFKLFINDYGLPKKLFCNNENETQLINGTSFINFLISIYSDVPLKFKFNGIKWIIKIKDDSSLSYKDVVNSISYSIEQEK